MYVWYGWKRVVLCLYIWLCNTLPGSFSDSNFVIKYTLTVYFFSSFNFNIKFDFEIFDKTTVIIGQGDWIMI